MSKRAVHLLCCLSFVGLLLFAPTTPSAWAQTHDEDQRDEAAAPRERSEPPPHRDGVYYIEDDHYGDDLIDYDSEPPYDYYERHWRRQARDYRRARDRSYRSYRPYRGYRGYDDRPRRRYYGDEGYDYYGYGEESFDRGYRDGRRDGRRYAEWERRNELGRRGYADAMSDGLLAFRNGDYSQAVRNFIRAAKINQGDPASRIHAAHAMVAIERYHEALPALRRAFQLQPKIAYLALDIRRDYGVKTDFDAHLKNLRQSAGRAEDDPALWLLLGYYEFYSGREAKAVRSLAKSDALAPGDFMTEALLDAARRVAPAFRQPAQKKRGGKHKPEPKGKKKAGKKKTGEKKAERTHDA